MDLTPCLDKSTRWIQMLTHGVVIHCLDHRKGHTLSPEVFQGILDKRPTIATPLSCFINSKIWNTTLLRLAIEACADVAKYFAILLCDKNSLGLAAKSSSTCRAFPPAPVVGNRRLPVPALRFGQWRFHQNLQWFYPL